MSTLDIEKEHIKVLLSVSGVFTFCRANDDKQDLSLALTATEKLCSELLSSDKPDFHSLRLEFEDKIKTSDVKNKDMLLGLVRYHEFYLKKRKIHSAEDLKFYIQILLKVIPLLKQYLNSDQSDQFKDLLEAVHCLTDALTNHLWDEDAFWKTFLIPYRSKWDESFLIEEEAAVFQNKNSR